MHNRNFLARGSAVKQHGAILGMQMHCNRTGFVNPSFRGDANRGPRKARPGGIEPGISRFRVRSWSLSSGRPEAGPVGPRPGMTTR